MLFHYLKITLRTLVKHKAFAIINFIGLSLGLTAGVLILLYVSDELAYDQFHENRDRIYRVTSEFRNPETGESEGAMSENAWPVGRILETEFPEVEQSTYLRNASFFTLTHQGNRFQQQIHFTDNAFLAMFSFELKSGNKQNALSEAYTAVISEAMEQKFFPNESALGKTIVFEDTLQITVTGVMYDIPNQSHIQSDIFLSFATFEQLSPLFGSPFTYSDGWGMFNVFNYILLKPTADVEHLISKAGNLYMDRVGDMMRSWGANVGLGFEPLGKIYLHSKAGNPFGKTGSIDRVYLVAGIAGFVILLACINFINLTTARSVYRAKEVGLRKVVGSSRSGLVIQFLAESFWVTILSLVITLGFLGVALPYFNQLLEKSYELTALLQTNILLGMVVLVLVITFISGYYPAILLSGMRPVEVLKGRFQHNKSGVNMRRGLVVFQFLVSISLVLATFIVMNQLHFMQKKELGFAKDEVLVIRTSRVPKHSLDVFKNEVKSLSAVKNLSASNAVPGRPGWQGQIAYPEGKESGADAVSMEYMAIDEAYLETLDLELIAGSNFNTANESDMKEGLIINEQAVKALGWETPENAIGKRIVSPSGTPAGIVIGVVKNYHQQGLQHKIGAIAMDVEPAYCNLYSVRYQASETQVLIQDLQALWNTYYEGYDFNYFFLNENFERQYLAEKRLASVFTLFAIITVIIAVIGLVGLVSFMVVSKTKEIGIRKVLGANIWSITQLLNKEFLILVLLAACLAAPLAWYGASEWLNSFAYRMELNPLLFITSGTLALMITLIAVSVLTIRAAMANPVDSLKNE